MRLCILYVLLLLPLTIAQVLEPFSSCPSLTAYYKRAALARVGPYGLRGSFVFRRGPIFALSSPPRAEKAPEAGVDFSETNVQVAGVDEPDIVKTDGKRVFVLSGRNFYVVNVRKDGEKGKRTGALELPSYAREMLLDGDDILVFGTDYGLLDNSKAGSSRQRFGGFYLFLPFGQPVTVIYRLSVKERQPKLIATLRVEGSYLSARLVDGIARVITTSTPSNQIKFRFPDSKTSEKAAKRLNKKIIRNTNTAAWLSRYYLKDGSGESRGFLTPCSSVYRSSGKFAGFTQLTVITLPIAGPLRPRNSVSIASDGDEVYSTTTNLYVTTTDYRYDFAASSRLLGSTFRTSLHLFALSKTGQTYVASGLVTGSVLNQFSMHEYKDKFYVATTLGAPWWASRDTSVSKVTEFTKNVTPGKLVKTGTVGNLGRGERIYAVRYIQDIAYVVTFRQVDPLYVISLKELKVLGELKIPGFSSYLHLIGPGLILGVGQDATPEGRTTGAKVTLFDVSDVNNPTQLSTWSVKGGSSAVEWDHRAFLYWAPEKVAVLPLSIYEAGKYFAGSVVLEISSTEITERGRVAQSPCCGNSRAPRIVRNLILGRTHLWSLSSQQLQVNGIKDLDLESVIPLVRK